MTLHQLYELMTQFGLIEEIEYVDRTSYLISIVNNPKANCLTPRRDGSELKLYEIDVPNDTTKVVARWTSERPKRIAPKYIRQEQWNITEMLREPCDEASDKHMLSMLNDHILLSIFAPTNLDFHDMLALSYTSKRFRFIAQRVMKSHYERDSNEHFAGIVEQKTLWRIDHYLKVFGESITSVDVDNEWQNGQIVLGLIKKHCKNVNQLRCQVDGRTETWQSFGQFFHPNSELTYLHITSNLMPDLTLPAVKLPKLVELRMEDVCLSENVSNDDFFALNTQIRDVTMLDTEITHNTAQQFNKLNALESLHIQSNDGTTALSVLTALNEARAPLARLTLEGKRFPRYHVEYTIMLKNFTGLKFFDIRVPQHYPGFILDKLLPLVSEMTSLDHLHVLTIGSTIEEIKNSLIKTKHVPLECACFVLLSPLIDWRSAADTIKNLREVADDRNMQLTLVIDSVSSVHPDQLKVCRNK